MAVASSPGPVPQAPGAHGAPADGILTVLAGAVRSEWTKVRTARSSYWTMGVLAVASVVLGSCIAAVDASGIRSGSIPAAGLDPAAASLSSLASDGPLIAAVLGVLMITPEFSSGMIRTSLIVQPRRGTMLAAKGLVLAAVLLAVSALTSFAAFFAGQAILGAAGSSASLSDPGVLRAVLGTALYVTVTGLIAFAIGTIIRHTAGAIALLAGLMWILPLIAAGFSMAGGPDISRWLPSEAGTRMASAVVTPGVPGPWAQLGVTAAWAAVLLAAGTILVSRRDA